MRVSRFSMALAAGALVASLPAQSQVAGPAHDLAAPSPEAQVFARLSDAELERRVSAVLDPFHGSAEFVGLAVAVARGDHVIVDRGFGIADIEWNAPVDTNTTFRIGSLTKQFTAAAILKLAEQGKLALEDPLSRYVPEFDTGGHVVTIRQLLNHTSGLPEYTTQPDFFAKLAPLNLSDAELLQLVSGKPFDFEPGTEWRYSNTGYYLLGMVVTKVSGRPYAAFMQDEFFTPLGLAHTRYGSETEIIAHRAQGYSFRPGHRLACQRRAISMNTPGAGGALLSSAGDLVRWQIALTNGRAIRPASFEQMIGSPVKATGGGRALRVRGDDRSPGWSTRDHARRRHQRLQQRPDLAARKRPARRGDLEQ